MPYRIGIDVGGTFTDLVCIDELGNTVIEKVPSTPRDQSIAVMNALEKAAASLSTGLQQLLSNTDIIVHGTTVTTNAVLTLTGSKCGLLTTKGFRDVFEIRRGIREMEHRYDYTVPSPTPLVPRYLRIGVEERIDSEGKVITPLNEETIQSAVEKFKKESVEAVAVSFLWSFRNPTHEAKAAELVKKIFPDAYISASIDILPEIREYERVSTTILNAYVGPKLARYLDHLDTSLKQMGFPRMLLITQSSGGVMSVDVARKQAVRTLLSGPACGPPAGALYGEIWGLDKIITMDMGGTSFDVCLVKGGMPWMTTEGIVARYHIRVPMVDVHTIGAGGGSIAWLDSLRALHVGPRSAGAEPGPACYERGGLEPTVTDADLILGYLNPEYFLGGEIKLRADLAEKAVKEKIAEPLGISVLDAAKAIYDVVNANMADAISVVSVQRGEDTREYVLVPAGGAGPVHAPALAQELKIPKIIVPRLSSVFCALGGVTSSLRHDLVRTLAVRSSDFPVDKVNQLYLEMESEGANLLEVEKVLPSNRQFLRSMDIRYVGQFHEVEVPVPNGVLAKEHLLLIEERFHEKHKTLYGYRDDVEIEIINQRVVALGRVRRPKLPERPYAGKDPAKALKGTRAAFFKEAGKLAPVAVYGGDDMGYGNVVDGPAIIEQRTTTITIPPGFRVEVGKYGDFIIDVPRRW